MASLCPTLQQQLSHQLSAAIDEIYSMYDTIDATALAALLLSKSSPSSREVLVVDVRDEEEFNHPDNVFINGSVNIPHHVLLEDVSSIKKALDQAENKNISQIVFVSQASPDLDSASALLWSDAVEEMAAGEEKERYSNIKLSILLGGVGTWTELHGGDAALTGSTPKKGQ